MTPREPPEIPPHKTYAEMSTEERREFVRELQRVTRKELAELNRARRERKLRAGTARPRNRAEMEIFCADLRREEVIPDAETLSRTEQLPDDATAEDIGKWMAGCLKQDRRLDQPPHGASTRRTLRGTIHPPDRYRVPGHLQDRPPGLPQGRW
jgi:hypothetical protein